MARRLKSPLLLGLLTAGVALSACASEPGSASPEFEPMLDAAAPEVRSFTVDGLTLIFQPAEPDPNLPDRTEDDHEPLVVYAAAMAPGLKPAIIARGSYPPGTVPMYAVVKLDAADPAPSLLVQTYSGGAHCCNDYIAVTPVGDALKVVPIGFFNGGPGGAVPQDLDGDGRVEFAVRDDRFLYTFAPYAGSWAPPMFLNVIDGRTVDVTTRPAFRKQLEDYAADALASCADTSEDMRNGACAAYVGVKARLGEYEQALKQVVDFVNREETDFMPIGCQVDPGTAMCPEDQQIHFRKFEDAIAYHLKDIGYLD